MYYHAVATIKLHVAPNPVSTCMLVAFVVESRCAAYIYTRVCVLALVHVMS
jgi:hypothetical protein